MMESPNPWIPGKDDRHPDPDPEPWIAIVSLLVTVAVALFALLHGSGG